MSRRADPWDTALVELFFKTLKRELCGDKALADRVEARTSVFEYTEMLYNRERLRSFSGYATLGECELISYRAGCLRRNGLKVS